MQLSSPAPRLPYPLAVLAVCTAVGLLLTLCDRYSHVQFGVLSYAQPSFNRQAWWVLPNFIAAALGMYLGARLLFARWVAVPSTGRLAGNLLLFVLAYVATGLFAAWPSALLAGLVLAWLLRLALAPRSERRVQLAWALVLAVVGGVMEGSIAATGAFRYAAPDVFNVPYWLAALYLHGSFLVLDIVRLVEHRYGR